MTDCIFDPRYVKSSRKLHKCYWCGEMILIFAPNVTCKGVFDGKFHTQHYHPECQAAGLTLSREDLEIMTCFFKRGTTEEK